MRDSLREELEINSDRREKSSRYIVKFGITLYRLVKIPKESTSKMWQVCLLSALMATSFCAAQPKNTKAQECGRSKPRSTEGIASEKGLALPGELPWMVLVYYKTVPIGSFYNCNGVLIHPKVVLVSTQCAMGDLKYEPMVRAGVLDVGPSSTENTLQERAVSGLIDGKDRPFPYLIDSHGVNMLILASPFELTENVGVACVPCQKDVFDRSGCIASGWDRESLSGRDLSKLRRVSSPIISDDKPEVYKQLLLLFGCRASLSELEDFKGTCVGAKEYPGLCQDGNALFCPLADDPSRYAVVGLAMYPLPCRAEFNQSLPTYANVLQDRRWIDDEIRAIGISPLDYTICST